MKEHSPFSLNNKTKYELVRYAVELEQCINRAIKILDEATGKEAARAIQILKGEKMKSKVDRTIKRIKEGYYE